MCFLSSLQAGIDRRVLINAADISTNFTIAGASNDTLKKKLKQLVVQHYMML